MMKYQQSAPCSDQRGDSGKTVGQMADEVLSGQRQSYSLRDAIQTAGELRSRGVEVTPRI